MPITRRQALQAAVGAPLLGAAPLWGAQQPRRRPRIAAIYTVCYHRSHAHVLLENFLTPFLFNGRITEPAVDVVSLYADQRSTGRNAPDLTDEITRRFKVPLFKTIDAALTLGGKELAVDAVLAIGEHGNYPASKLGVREYPRKRFFDEMVATMRRSNRFVPIFNDKHLSYRWDWAREMYDTCQTHRIPFMAGSSVPLAQRRPPLELPANCAIEEAISIHGGPFEAYDFHGLEVLEAFIEARKGGETGVTHVEFLKGEPLWQAAQQGRWSIDLARVALRAEFGDKVPDITRPLNNVEPYGILLTLGDGTKATMLKVGSSGTRWNFACKLAGEREPRFTLHHVGPWNNRCLFMALAHAIQQFFVTGASPYPVERTLLTTGVLEAAVRSRGAGERVATPHLNIRYPARDFRALREMGESWKILTEGTKETVGFAARPLRQ
ncbi:MAG TPA: hypothetical protein VNX28_12295 [Gemmataceae bacterium]|jgi:hypothetical protein|nr:hypothetical protein [Gemmataceae bacterium]